VVKRKMLTAKSVWTTALLLLPGAGVWGDYIVTDGIKETLACYDDSFSVVRWQSTTERSIGHLIISPINDNVYVGYSGVDKLAKQYDVYLTGVFIASTIPSGDHVNDLRFGLYYNRDDIPNLWLLSRESLYVYDGATTPNGNPAVLLDRWTIADATGADLGTVSTDFGVRYHLLVIDHGPNSTILIGTWFSIDLDPDNIPNTESNYGNLIQYDPAANTSQLLLESSFGRITGAVYVGPATDPPCPNPPAAGLSGDCRVNVDDLVIFLG